MEVGDDEPCTQPANHKQLTQVAWRVGVADGAVPRGRLHVDVGTGAWVPTRFSDTQRGQHTQHLPTAMSSTESAALAMPHTHVAM